MKKKRHSVPTSTYSHSRTGTRVIDLNVWHHAIHQVTGDMALRFNRATADDLERWSEALRVVAEEMRVVRRR